MTVMIPMLLLMLHEVVGYYCVCVAGRYADCSVVVHCVVFVVVTDIDVEYVV